MLVFPHAKINLGLNVTGKRSDGYHNITSVLFPVPVFDALEIIPADSFSFENSGLAIPGNPDENLIIKAWQLLNKDFQIDPVKIHLLKKIPMGGGLGGGSSDAAFTLHVLNELFQLKLSKEQLHEYASELGSDCPFFLYNNASMASGRGTDLTPVKVDLSEYNLVLIFPGLHSGTKEAYEGLQPKNPKIPVSEIIFRPPTEWKNELKNDFESTIFRKFPVLNEIKSDLYKAGADYASMSGSGSTMFGLFKKPPAQISKNYNCISVSLGDIPA